MCVWLDSYDIRCCDRAIWEGAVVTGQYGRVQV